MHLYGSFMDATQAPLDVLDAAELAELERIAIDAMSYDGECYVLAEVFLEDYSDATDYDRARLARHVQLEVESWLEQEMKS